MGSESRSSGATAHYAAATRHPWACLAFLAPLLLAYEGGVLWLGGSNPDALRNGADAWVRWGLARYGFGQPWAAPLLVAALFALRSATNWSSRPKELVGTLFGMATESAIFAVALWAFSRNFKPILDACGVVLADIKFQSPAAGQVVTYVGAGIYEEVLFRLGLFSVVVLLLRLALLPKVMAIPLAAVGTAVAFSAAHHIGPNGEWPINSMVFAFRAAAGLYFTALYIGRGFGVAVGAHAGYDVLVGVTV
jgi:hypothetical protein